MNIFLKCMLFSILWTSIAVGQSVQSFGTTHPHPYHKVDAFPYIAEAGFRWVRLSAFWDQIETTEDQFNFEILDYNVNKALEQGLNILLQVHPFFPSWIENNEEPRNC